MTPSRKGSIYCPSSSSCCLPPPIDSGKIAAVDLDGTLLDAEKRISSENAHAIEQLIELGFSIVLTTGRVYQHTLPYYQQLGLQGPLVTADGASVRIPNGRHIRDVSLPRQAVATILRSAQARQITALSFRRDGIRVTSKFEWNDDMDRHRRELPNHFGHSAVTAVVRSKVHKILLMGPSPLLQSFEASLPESVISQSNLIRNSITLEFTARGVDKVSGLSCLGTPEQVTFFGDGNNDVAALRWAHQSFAMNHATDAAKDAAKLIAPPSSAGTNFAVAVQLFISTNNYKDSESNECKI